MSKEGESAPLIKTPGGVPPNQHQYPPTDPSFNAADYPPHNINAAPEDRPPNYDAVQIGYQPPPPPAEPNIYQPQGGRPVNQDGLHLPGLKKNNNESDKYLLIGAILTVISLLITGFSSICCAVPFLICGLMAMTTKEDDIKRLQYSKLSICGGICALVGGIILIFGVAILFGVVQGLANAENATADYN